MFGLQRSWPASCLGVFPFELSVYPPTCIILYMVCGWDLYQETCLNLLHLVSLKLLGSCQCSTAMVCVCSTSRCDGRNRFNRFCCFHSIGTATGPEDTASRLLHHEVHFLDDPWQTFKIRVWFFLIPSFCFTCTLDIPGLTVIVTSNDKGRGVVLVWFLVWFAHVCSMIGIVSNQDWEPPQDDDKGKGLKGPSRLKLYRQRKSNGTGFLHWHQGEGEEDFETTKNSSIINQSCLAALHCKLWLLSVVQLRVTSSHCWDIPFAASQHFAASSFQAPGQRALQNQCALDNSSRHDM